MKGTLDHTNIMDYIIYERNWLTSYGSNEISTYSSHLIMGHNWFAQEQQLDETMDGMLFVWIEKHT